MKYIALVSGSSRGIGKSIVKTLIANGYFVVGCGFSPPEKIQTVISELGDNFSYVRCDISDENDIKRLYDYIHTKYDRLDLLVNNAGVAPKERKDILLVPSESFDHVINTNLRGTFFMCQTFANLMIEYKKSVPEKYDPKIINISSCSAYTSSVSRGEYCISKAGISMVTKLFADRLAEYNISVFEIRPGIIRTDMTAPVIKKYEQMISDGLTPTKRMGEPQDVANCVLALSSGLFDFSTGQAINVDGGFHIRRL